MNMNPPTMGMVALLVWSLGGGCATRPTETVGPVAFPVRSVPPTPAGQLLSLQPRTGRFTYVRNAAEPVTLDFSIARDGNEWDFQLQGLRRARQRLDQEGNVLLMRETEEREGVAVLYDPPLTLLPAQLSMDQPFAAQSKMVVHDVRTNQVRDQGQCEYQVELLGLQKVITPAGTFDAYLVRSRRRITLSLAAVQVTIDSHYATGWNLVAESIQRTTKVMGLFETTETESLRRLD